MPHVSYFWDEIEDNVIEEYDENGHTIGSYTTEPTLDGSVLSQDRGGEKRCFQFDGDRPRGGTLSTLTAATSTMNHRIRLTTRLIHDSESLRPNDF